MKESESYKEIVKKIKNAETEYQVLTKKLDDMEAETSVLKSKITACEEEEKAIYDSYFLGNASDKNLADIRKKVQAAKESLSSHSKMLESLNRCIGKKEKEIAALHKQSNVLRHQTWQSLFEQKTAEIPENVKALVKELITIGLNCSMGRDFILPKIFPLPTNSEIQGIYKQLSGGLNIE